MEKIKQYFRLLVMNLDTREIPKEKNVLRLSASETFLQVDEGPQRCVMEAVSEVAWEDKTRQDETPQLFADREEQQVRQGKTLCRLTGFSCDQ